MQVLRLVADADADKRHDPGADCREIVEAVHHAAELLPAVPGLRDGTVEPGCVVELVPHVVAFGLDAEAVAEPPTQAEHPGRADTGLELAAAGKRTARAG